VLPTLFNAEGAIIHHSLRSQPALQPAALALQGFVHQTKLWFGRDNTAFDMLHSAARKSGRVLSLNQVVTQEKSGFVLSKLPVSRSEELA